jgi:hypothetical protein
MAWALTLQGRADPAAIILLVDDRDEAEIIAQEVRRNGTEIVIRPYPGQEAVSSSRPPSGGLAAQPWERR